MHNQSTPNFILNRLSRAKINTKDWHTKIREYRKLYNFDQYESAKAKRGEFQFQDPTYNNVVDLSVNILLANRLSWSVAGWEPSYQELQETSESEKYLDGLLHINSQREEYDILYEMGINFVRDGAAVLYSVWDPKIQERAKAIIEMPDEDEGSVARVALKEPPLIVQVVDPLTVYLLEGGPKRWLCVFRAEKRSVFDIEMEYGITPAGWAARTLEDKTSADFEFIDYWCFDQESDGRVVVKNAIMYSGVIIKPLVVMDGYEDLPYTVGFYKPVNRSEPRNWGHSVIDPLKTSVSALGRIMNRMDRQVTTYSSLPLIHSGPAGGQKIDLDPGMGNITKLNSDEDLGFVKYPGGPPEVNVLVNYYRDKVQQSGFSDVLLSDASGYALNQLGDQNRLRLNQPARQFERLLRDWAKKAMALTSVFGNKAIIRVHGVTSNQFFTHGFDGQIAGKYTINVKLKPEYPNEKVRNHAMANQMRGVLSDRYIMEHYLDIDQPDEMQEQMLQEEILKHPALVQYAIFRELSEKAEGGDKIAAEFLQVIQQTGMPGTQGRPGESQAKEQPGGLQSSTGEATPQAKGGPPPGQDTPAQIQTQVNKTPGMV